MKETVKTTVALICLIALCTFTSCGSKWEQVSNNSVRCLSNESNNTMLLLSIPSNGHIGALIDTVYIFVDDYKKPLPNVIVFEASFGENPTPTYSPQKQNFHVINYNNYSPDDKSIDGFYGKDGMGRLLIIMTNERLKDALLDHQDDKNGCKITSSSFTQSHTFRIKELGETLIRITSRNAGW